MINDSVWFSISLMVVAFVVTNLVYPHVLGFARKHNVVDNPNARKLQRVPVPVMGGTTVFIGLLVTTIVGSIVLGNLELFEVLAILAIMYAIGAWDDVKDVPASLRFVVELFVVWAIIIVFNIEINDFHGLWGINKIPESISIPLSLIAGVGIINGVNLIDGVDGYCSSYGVMACVAFAVIFLHAGDMAMFTLALIAIGAVIPFFFHNVFGVRSKMFLGDGGSLMLGTLLTMFTFNSLDSASPCAAFARHDGLSMVALMLAILAVPVFDTLKVMIYRMARGTSPFSPDKTHLHHMFIEMGFSHLATSGIIVMCNALIVGLLTVCWQLRMPVNGQFYVVVGVSILFTSGLYFFIEKHKRMNDGDGSEFYQRLCRHGKGTNITTTSFWKFLKKIVDSRFLGGKRVASVDADALDAALAEDNPTGIDPRIQ